MTPRTIGDYRQEMMKDHVGTPNALTLGGCQNVKLDMCVQLLM
jgi:hypothetical protein